MRLFVRNGCAGVAPAIPRIARVARVARAVLLPLTFVLPALLIGCGDDSNPSDPAGGTQDTTGTCGARAGDSLVSVYFPCVFTNQDSAGFEQMLDDRYTFVKLPAFPGQPERDRICDREDVLRIVGRMFRGEQNPDGLSVESITVNINVVSTTPSFDIRQEVDETWFDVVAIVDMTVVLNDSNSTDGTGILNLLIDSNQKFVITQDVNSPGEWVIVKQEDQARINRLSVAGPPRTESSTWTQLLSLFDWTDETGGDGNDVSRATIPDLLHGWFPYVYSHQDSAGYDLALDDRYTFQRLPDDPDDPDEDLFWDKTEEARIAGRMFRGTPNDSGQSVESITLNINVGSTVPSFDVDQPPDEEWFDVVTIVDMTVVLNDPNLSDGTGILNLLIDSEQKFIVTADPDSPNDWVIVKQEDQQRIQKAGGSQATEEASWSDVKGLFR